MTYTDAHIHLVPCGALPSFADSAPYYACTCAHSPSEFRRQKALIAALAAPHVHIVSAFGIHPQDSAADDG
ncbi:MAG: hypothetical protein K2I74_02360, partial [Treponemataceae bacterium]|nr:hypothetical protein [Treponemataceae bacterium]